MHVTRRPCKDIAMRGKKEHGAIASELAGKIYGLNSLEANIEDASHNTTRFILMSSPLKTVSDEDKMITSLFLE